MGVFFLGPNNIAIRSAHPNMSQYARSRLAISRCFVGRMNAAALTMGMRDCLKAKPVPATDYGTPSAGLDNAEFVQPKD